MNSTTFLLYYRQTQRDLLHAQMQLTAAQRMEETAVELSRRVSEHTTRLPQVVCSAPSTCGCRSEDFNGVAISLEQYAYEALADSRHAVSLAQAVGKFSWLLYRLEQGTMTSNSSCSREHDVE